MKRGLAVLLLAPMFVMARPDGATAQEQCASAGPTSQRRTEALRAVRMFNTAASAEGRSPLVPRPRTPEPPYPEWSDLGTSGSVAMWRADGGPTGDLARKIRGGDIEPLPGWEMHWVASADGYAFTLTDVRDRCGFSYSSDERGVILQGVTLQPRFSVLPAETP